MSVNLFCPLCKRSSSRSAKVCQHCRQPFGATRKYRVDVRSSATGGRVTQVVGSLKEANDLETSLKGKAVTGDLQPKAKAPLVKEAWERFLGWAKGNKKSWQSDKYMWGKHLAPRFENRRMDQINPIEVQTMMDEMKAAGVYSPATVKHAFVLLRRVYNWSAEMGVYRGPNPSNGLKAPKLNNERVACLSKAEIKKLVEVLDEWENRRVALLIKFALFTGCRRGELLKLRWDDVALEPPRIHLRNPKNGTDAVIPISDEAKSILVSAMSAAPYQNCPIVFPNHKGEQRRCVKAIWKRIKEQAGLSPELRFHDLRHSYASHLASSGKVSLYTIQRLLNHNSPRMTQRYAHLLDDTLRNGANVMGSILD